MGMTSLLSRGKGAAGSSSERDYGTKGPNDSDVVPDNDSEAGMHFFDPLPTNLKELPLNCSEWPPS